MQGFGSLPHEACKIRTVVSEPLVVTGDRDSLRQPTCRTPIEITRGHAFANFHEFSDHHTPAEIHDHAIRLQSGRFDDEAHPDPMYFALLVGNC